MAYFNGDNISFYPNYERGELDYYLKCARVAKIASPLFLKIMNLSESCLSNEYKNLYIDFYASVYPDFFRQIKGAMAITAKDPLPNLGTVQVVENLPSLGPKLNDDRDPTPETDRSAEVKRLEQQARILGFALVPLSQASKCALSGGRKSRRRSNRKNRSRR